MPTVPAVVTQTQVLSEPRQIFGPGPMREILGNTIGSFVERRETMLEIGGHEFDNPVCALFLNSRRDVNQDQS